MFVLDLAPVLDDQKFTDLCAAMSSTSSHGDVCFVSKVRRRHENPQPNADTSQNGSQLAMGLSVPGTERATKSLSLFDVRRN